MASWWFSRERLGDRVVREGVELECLGDRVVRYGVELVSAHNRHAVERFGRVVCSAPRVRERRALDGHVVHMQMCEVAGGYKYQFCKRYRRLPTYCRTPTTAPTHAPCTIGAARSLPLQTRERGSGSVAVSVVSVTEPAAGARRGIAACSPVDSAPASAPARQPASADAELHAKAGNYDEQYDPGQGVCIVEGTQFPMRYAVMAAIHHLDRWVKTGRPPPEGARYQFDAAGALARDADGNALGGIRLPPIAVPVASYRSDLCDLGGITIPFTELQLATRYASHADYLCRLKTATRQSLDAGFLLPEEAAELLTRAAAAANRFLVAGTPDC